MCFEVIFALSSAWNEVTGERVISVLRKPISFASFVKANKYLSEDFLPGCQAVAGGGGGVGGGLLASDFGEIRPLV